MWPKFPDICFDKEPRKNLNQEIDANRDRLLAAGREATTLPPAHSGGLLALIFGIFAKGNDSHSIAGV